MFRLGLKGPGSSLLLVVLLIMIISLFSLYSASHYPSRGVMINYTLKQIIWLCLGVLAFVIIIKFGYERCIDYAYLIFAVNVILLILVLVAGSTRLGAKRWIDIGFFNLQPSELCKISIILVLVKFVASNLHRLYTKRVVLLALIICVFPMFLIIKQPDLGTSLVFLPILFVILFTAGAKIKYLVSMILVGLSSLPVFWFVLKDYQKKRLMVFLNPDADPLGAGYTVTQSKIAVGSGGFLGSGWLSGTQNRLNFLPERHTDFIFSVIGEEWGFLGSVFVIGIFILLLHQMFRITEETSDVNGKLLISGIITLIWFQIFVNISMTIGLMPVVGLPLPLVSYGGSSLLSTMILLGLAYSVWQKRKIF
ncbi:MAG: rod shape-determining protein RodA [Candidatus Omnitrophota bacterium]